MAKIYNIAVIKGDGIGPEIVDEAIKALDAASAEFGFEVGYNFYLMGGAAVGGGLLCERTVGLLDGGGVGVLTHAEDRVEVLRHPVLTGHVRVTASLSG